MIIKYFQKSHLNVRRKYVADEIQRMWMTKLTRKATITPSVEQALINIGIKLVEVDPPKERQ